jgi:hypothetical protein
VRNVIVQRAARPGGRTPESWELGPGDTLTVGRGAPEHPVDVVLSHPGVPRVAATIEASADFWLLSNHGSELAYVVDDPEGGGDFIRVGPGRSHAPIPFEFARLAIPVEGGTVDLLVFAPEHDYSAAVRPAGREDLTVLGFSLDKTAKYFKVLVALCEPRLRSPAVTTVPGTQAIADRLGLSRSAVSFHLDYLAKFKLHVGEREEDDPEARMDGRRYALATTALRFGLVTADDLRVLDG